MMGNYKKQRNSLQQTSEDIATEILMLRNFPRNKTKSFLIVEGPRDVRVYNRFVNEEKCYIMPALGKLFVLDTLVKLESRGFPGVLAVVDADFDILRKKESASQNLLFTDTHDLETMIIKSSAFDEFMIKLDPGDEIGAFLKGAGVSEDIRTILVRCGTPIGYLRWISERNDFSMTFKDMPFDRFVEETTITLNVTNLIEAVKVGSPAISRAKLQQYGISNERIEATIEQLQKANFDDWYVCSGHDLACILKKLFKLAGQKVELKEIEKELRETFRTGHFHETQLYLSIQTWEKANQPYVVLSVK